MSKSKKLPAALLSPWSDFDPPADLPDDLKAVYNLAGNPILIATSFCSHPERFGLPLEPLSSWFGPLRQACDELAGWVRSHEANLRAEAPDVLTALQRVFGVVEPLCGRLGAMIALLDGKPADANNAELVALVKAVRENSVKNKARLSHATLDGISVTGDSLTELRSALSGWAKRREPAARPPAGLKGTPTVNWESLLTAPPLTAREIAERLVQPVELVERALKYFRDQFDHGFFKIDNAGVGKARFRYEMPKVLSYLQQWYVKRQKKAKKWAPAEN